MAKFTPSYSSGATPIDSDEIKDLIPDYISTMQELNQVEQSNISDALLWVEKQDASEFLTATFILKLHQKMFEQVWKWAGKMRRSNKNIGVMKEHIMNDLGQLLKDTEYWIENETFTKDEIATRFHHRLVQIHIFPNGNGRHARLMTDLLLEKINHPKFTWGQERGDNPLEVENKTRNEYVAALRKCDAGDFASLISFVRS